MASGRRLRVLALSLASIFNTAGFSPAVAQAPGATEYQVKAAYLYNFGRFVEWPSGLQTDGTFAICVVGQDPFGQILDSTVAGLSIDGRAVVARRFAKAQDATSCRIVFISASEDLQLDAALAAFERRNVLTVSDIPQFAKRGGVIQFVQVGRRVRFEINLATAHDAGLVLSADLLKVAVVVHKDGRTGA